MILLARRPAADGDRRAGTRLDRGRGPSSTPAGALGVGDRIGHERPGLTSDLVVLDDDLSVQRVMAAGTWLP
jgi:N-acetylglucosamine-6-phosphate deacetylase